MNGDAPQPQEDADGEGRQPGKQPGLRRLWPLLVVLAGIVTFFALDFDRYLSFQALSDHREDLLRWTAENRAVAALVFIAVYALVVGFSLPGATWATLAGGFMFGTFEAAFYVLIGATAGATAIFLVARYALHDFFHAKAKGALLKMEQGFRENALSYLLFLRLVPLFPFWLVNLVPALLGVSLPVYVIGTFLGIIPGTIVYSSVGNGLGMVFEKGGMPDMNIIFEPQILVPIIGLAVLSLVPIAYKRLQRKRGSGG